MKSRTFCIKMCFISPFPFNLIFIQGFIFDWQLKIFDSDLLEKLTCIQSHSKVLSHHFSCYLNNNNNNNNKERNYQTSNFWASDSFSFFWALIFEEFLPRSYFLTRDWKLKNEKWVFTRVGGNNCWVFFFFFLCNGVKGWRWCK